MWSLPDILLYRFIETWANLAAVFEEAELYHFDIFTSKPQSVPQSKTNIPLYGAGDWSDKHINAFGWSGLLVQWVQCKITTSWHPSPKTARYLRIVLQSDGGASHGRAVSTDLQLDVCKTGVFGVCRWGVKSQQSIAQYHNIQWS